MRKRVRKEKSLQSWQYQWKLEILTLLGPMPPSGRRTQTGWSGQDTVWGGYILEKNHEKPTWNHEIHGNQPKTMKNHETTLKNHGNQPKTMKNPETT